MADERRIGHAHLSVEIAGPDQRRVGHTHLSVEITGPDYRKVGHAYLSVEITPREPIPLTYGPDVWIT